MDKQMENQNMNPPTWEPIGAGPVLELNKHGMMVDPSGKWAWNGQTWVPNDDTNE